jgi:Ca-activated chloride channel family protein
VDVAVFSASGMPITTLEKQDFQVFEDGRRQEVQSFAASGSAYDMLLLIDRSGSMQAQIPFLVQAINRFFINTRSQDLVSLAVFDASVHRLMNWRSVRQGREQQINIGAGGNTDFYGALDWAGKEVRKIRRRKGVLVFSDGEDYRIYDPQEDAKVFRKTLRNVKQANTPFNFVGLGADPILGGAHLKQLAEISGGHAYFPEKIDEVVPLYDQISRELGLSYTLGYLSDRPLHNGSYRKIEIVTPGKDYRISQSRSGYYAN